MNLIDAPKSTRALKKKIDFKISSILKMINQAPRTNVPTPNSCRSFQQSSIQTSACLQQPFFRSIFTEREHNKTKTGATRVKTKQSNKSFDQIMKMSSGSGEIQELEISEWDEITRKQQELTTFSEELRENSYGNRKSFEKDRVKEGDGFLKVDPGTKRRRKASMNPQNMENRQKSSKDLIKTMKQQLQQLFERNRNEDENYKPRELLIKRLSAKFPKQKTFKIQK